MTDAIFQVLLTATWQSMLLAMLVLLIVLLFRERLAPRFRYLLWCIVLFRLALPILPATSWGVLPNHNPVVVNQSRDREGAVAPRETPLLERESQPDTVTQIVPPSVATPVKQKAAVINRDHVFAYAKKIILAIWVAGALVFGIRYVLDEIRLSRQSRYWKPVEDENLLAVFESCRRQIGIRRRVRLFAVSHGIGAATTGTFFPKVLLSEQAVLNPDTKQLRLVILHELVHLKRFDPLVLRLSVLLSVLHWPNPVVWLAISRLQRDRELACDAAVLHIIGSHDPTGTTQKDYGEAVLTFATLFSPREHLPGLVGLFPKHAIARRIEMILNHKKTNFFYATFGILLVLTVAAFGLTRAAEKTKDEMKPPVVKQEDSQTLTTTEEEPLRKEPYFQNMITGRVSMPNGTPAKGVSIKYKTINVMLSKEGDKVLASGSMIVETSTDENGKYYTNCPSSGDFRQISAVGQAYMKDEQGNATPLIAESVVIDFSKETQEINFTLQNGIPVIGTVRYPDGTPAKKQQVFFSRELKPIASSDRFVL